MIDAPQKYLV